MRSPTQVYIPRDCSILYYIRLTNWNDTWSICFLLKTPLEERDESTQRQFTPDIKEAEATLQRMMKLFPADKYSLHSVRV
jgi:hypothetical protein